MPRKAASPSLAETDAAPGGVGAVDKALSLLAAFRTGDAALSLAELAERTRLYKSAVLRLAASLEHGRLLQRSADGRYALGPELARLHGLYAAGFSLEAEVLPALQALVARTRESAALHVRQGEQRLCLFRVDSPQPLRDHLRVGDLLPLEQGAGGRVLLAFGGARGKRYEQIRAEGLAELDGDRVEGLAGIAAPVFRAGGELVGALTLSLPSSRLKPGLAAEVKRAAAALSRRLGG
ncbi:helix-turn-helix domain-containing protein [Roseateles sp. DAIF2]|uniref:IclR family transcriptional regulator n=1 Tax=Roseateles sp. DAIF2 TaxID=2714952 RepID=UPI0018A32918|nr:IclR family transcriptional regulator C-terminal domain-containing protein [Roseateles sp. DAIF2]QPF75885.1 helix-turn-helix domain-containing protein [Roseateles sp. DAIF2]